MNCFIIYLPIEEIYHITSSGPWPQAIYIQFSVSFIKFNENWIANRPLCNLFFMASHRIGFPRWITLIVCLNCLFEYQKGIWRETISWWSLRVERKPNKTIDGSDFDYLKFKRATLQLQIFQQCMPMTKMCNSRLFEMKLFGPLVVYFIEMFPI